MRRCTCGKQDQMRVSGLAKCIRQRLVIHVYWVIFAPLQHQKQTKTKQKSRLVFYDQHLPDMHFWGIPNAFFVARRMHLALVSYHV